MSWTNPTPEQVAADWIASRRGSEDDTCGILAGFLQSDFPEEEPELTWDAVLLILRTYSEADLYAATRTESQKVCGELAAGPVEDLLSFHGERFIARFEEEASCDKRMAWLLGGVWQYEMSDEIWTRVQLAADHSYWERPVDPGWNALLSE